MAHMVETMAYAGDVPWHGLGVPVGDDLTPMQMLEAAGLNWKVELQPLFAERDGRKIPTGHSALVRDTDDSVFDVVTDTWTPLQNHHAFDFFHEFVESGGAKMHTAGALRDGQVVWGLAKMGDAFEVTPGDVTESYLLLSNPHRYGASIIIMETPIRVVCNNTLTLAIGDKAASVAARYTHARAFDPEEAKMALAQASDKFAKYAEKARFLASRNADQETVIAYFDYLFPRAKEDGGKLSKPAQQIYNILDEQPGAELGRGTWWQAVNAVTYGVDHLLGRSVDTRLESAWFGRNAERKRQAVEYALKLAA